MDKSENTPKKRGGYRPGAGRRKNLPENEQGLPSGATPTKKRAREILDSLKISEVEWKKLHPDHPRVGTGEPEPCKCETCLWRWHAREQNPNGRAALEYLLNRDEGRPVQTVNHLHDKPIEMNVNVKLSEIIRQVRERKREYERNRK